MSARSQLLGAIAKTISDYRAGELPPPTTEHVDRWIGQFESSIQLPILTELAHVLASTYWPEARVRAYLASIASNKALVGDDPFAFWQGIKFLRIQTSGNSQRDMLTLFDKVIFEKCGLDSDDEMYDPEAYLYLDDAIFTGHRVKNDLIAWLERDDTPAKAKVYVITLAIHLGGQAFAAKKIQEATERLSKPVDISWWTFLQIEDRNEHLSTSDVLRPTHLPEDATTKSYAGRLGYPIVFRSPGHIGGLKFFSSEEGRDLLEQEFLKAGAKIRHMCPLLNQYQRPLGNMILHTLGFGSLLVTFRNCPNNCPLAFWAGDPWYPLFPRKTN